MNLGKDSFLISYSHKHIHINLHPQWLSSVPHHRNPHTNLSFFFVSDMMLWNTFKCLRRFSKSLFLHPVVKFVICRQQLLNTIQSFGYLLNDTEDEESKLCSLFYGFSMLSYIAEISFSSTLFLLYGKHWVPSLSSFTPPCSQWVCVTVTLNQAKNNCKKMFPQVQRNWFAPSTQIFYMWVLSTMALHRSHNGLNLSLTSV